jgi:hypothetical protein
MLGQELEHDDELPDLLFGYWVDCTVFGDRKRRYVWAPIAVSLTRATQPGIVPG